MVSELNDYRAIQGVVITDPVNIHGDGELHLGQGVAIQPFVTIVAQKKITIGEQTVIASGVQIIDQDHSLENLEEIKKVGAMREVNIGRYCWIGANAVILKGVTLGDYCVVGAGAVVTHSFPEKSIIVGNPARLLKTR